MLFDYIAWFMEDTVVICLAWRQSWTENTAVACIQSKQIRYGAMLLSYGLNRCFSVLHEMENLSISFQGSGNKRYEWCFSQIGNLGHWLASLRGLKEWGEVTCFLSQYLFSREKALMQRSFDLPAWRHDFPSFWSWEICKVCSFPYVKYGIKATFIYFWGQDFKMAFNLHKYFHGSVEHGSCR